MIHYDNYFAIDGSGDIIYSTFGQKLFLEKEDFKVHIDNVKNNINKNFKEINKQYKQILGLIKED